MSAITAKRRGDQAEQQEVTEGGGGGILETLTENCEDVTPITHQTDRINEEPPSLRWDVSLPVSTVQQR